MKIYKFLFIVGFLSISASIAREPRSLKIATPYAVITVKNNSSINIALAVDNKNISTIIPNTDKRFNIPLNTIYIDENNINLSSIKLINTTEKANNIVISMTQDKENEQTRFRAVRSTLKENGINRDIIQEGVINTMGIRHIFFIEVFGHDAINSAKIHFTIEPSDIPQEPEKF